MVTQLHLISRLVRIEMYNLHNVCPFVYKVSNDTSTIPLGDYCLKIDNKYTDVDNPSRQFVPLTNFYPISDSKIVVDNNVNKPLYLSNVYFINGYNKYVPILSHLESKYNLK